MLCRLLVSLLRLLPAAPLTDEERIGRARAECDTVTERVWESMRSRHVS
jgi:hypothetical protein